MYIDSETESDNSFSEQNEKKKLMNKSNNIKNKFLPNNKILNKNTIFN